MPNVVDDVEAKSTFVIVVDRRDFVRGCLNAWLGGGREFEARSMATVSMALQTDMLARADAVVFSVGAPRYEPWLRDQFAWLCANRADVPIVIIADADERTSIEASIGQLQLRGYIPTSSTLEMATAVLHLVVSGGTYLPRILDVDQQPPTKQARELIDPVLGPAAPTKLTPREQEVLELLQQGMANKMIAYQLGMSQSTVKAHVHSIMVKLKARNRTEAALMAHAQPAAPTTHHVEPAAEAVGSQVVSLKRRANRL